MNTYLNELGTEYDELLLKPDKTDEDYRRLDNIETLCWSHWGYDVKDGNHSTTTDYFELAKDICRR